MKSAPFITLQFYDGRLAAAYIYFRGEHAKTPVRSKCVGPYVVDYVGDQPSGIEIHSPTIFDLDAFNGILASLGENPLTEDESRPFLGP